MKRFLKLRYMLPIAVLLLAALAALIFFLVTKGTTYEEDGLTLNSRMEITNVRMEGNVVYSTFVNNTCRSFLIGGSPTVEKKVNGAWQLSESVFMSKAAWRVKPFSEALQSFSFDVFAEDIVGEYRLIEQGAVAYFTVTEEMVAALTDYKIYRTDGIRQSELIYVDGIAFKNNELTFTLHNDTLEQMTVPIGGEVQKKVNGEWVYYKSVNSKSTVPTVLDRENSMECTFLMSTDADGAGEYRLILCVLGYGPIVQTNDETKVTRLEFNEESIYVVGTFTIKQGEQSPLPEIYY